MSNRETSPEKLKYGKRHKPTAESRKLVSELSALGIKNEDVCAMIDTSIPTLLKHYEKEIKEGRIKANAKIAQTLYKKAIEGDTACLIFWAKTRLGWREDPSFGLQFQFVNVLPPSLPQEDQSDTITLEDSGPHVPNA